VLALFTKLVPCLVGMAATGHRGSERAEFVQLDMPEFDLGGRRCDTIMIAANFVLHLHSLDNVMGFIHSYGTCQ
jgi:hypothetical protein